VPRIGERYRKLAGHLPNAVRQDANRARTIIQQLIGDGIRVVTEDRLVKFVTNAGQVEAAFARMAGSGDRQIEVVAGAGFSTHRLSLAA
jgi:hypothetical protein